MGITDKGFIESRIRGLEKKQVPKENNSGVQGWWFRVVPTCPPSTSVTIRAGVAYPNPRNWFWLACPCQTPDNTVDFSDPLAPSGDGTVMNRTWNFNNANWYTGTVLTYHYEYFEAREPRGTNNWPYLLVCYGGTTEYETVEEVETYVDTLLNGGATMFYSHIPLWAVILRNNGTTSVDGQVLPIDSINRGRSYLYRDARARNLIW